LMSHFQCTHDAIFTSPFCGHCIQW